MKSLNLLYGLILLVIGLILLGINLGWWSPMVWDQLWHFWPVLLILIGLRLVIKSNFVFGFLGLILILLLLWGSSVGQFAGLRTNKGIGLPHQANKDQHSDRPRDRSMPRLFEPRSKETSQFKSSVSVTDLQKLTLDLGGLYQFDVVGQDGVTTVTADFSGPKELVDRLSLVPSGTDLVLKSENSPDRDFSFHFVDERATGTITIPKQLALDLKLSGAAKGTVKDHSATVSTDISGAGSIDFTSSTTTNPTLKLSGAGKISLDNCQGDGQVEISGAGKVSANSCSLTRLRVKTSGASDLDIKAGTIVDLEATASGASKIHLPKPSGKITEDSSGASKIEYRD